MRFLLFTLTFALLFAAAAEEVDFGRDVRPILSDKCFKCHGPDAKNQKSDFRIDTLEQATADLGNYSGVVPGSLKESEVHWRLHSDDDDDLMPPPKSKMPLTKKEIAIIDQWIEEGAKFQEHWAFEPVAEKIPVPVTDSEWVRNEIDQFVLSRLNKKKFSPSTETSREKWLRRVSFDLTGLAPTTAELDSFVADTSPESYEKVIDRLFATDSYAERLASEWLDVARYSDTYGYQVDRDRFVWPWRDWVIRAFKENLPYDQFITWQLAGDLLPNPTRDQIIATAFNRLHGQKVEGGSVPEEFRIEYVADRVHTYGTAFLGLTMECCRCHDHKYDPIKAKDYYQLSAFFDKIDEAGLYSFFTPAVPSPTLWLPNEGEEKQLDDLTDQIAATEKRIGQLAMKALPAFEDWNKAQSQPTSLIPPIAAFSFETIKKNAFTNAIDPNQSAKTSPRNKLVSGKTGQGVHLTGDDSVTLPVGNFTRDDAFSVSLWMKTPNEKKRAVIFSRSKAWADAASRGYELLLEEGKLSAALIHFYPGNSIQVRAKEKLPIGEWKHVTLTYDGSSVATGLNLYVDGIAVDTEIVRDNLTREITGGGSDTIVIGQRMRDNGFKNGVVDDFQVFDRKLTLEEINAVCSGSNFNPSLDYFLAHTHAPYQKATAKLKALKIARSELIKDIPEIMVMEETRDPLQTYVLGRGHYENRGEPVSPATPNFLPQMPEGAPQNRLGLAQWTTSPDNPLTARVTVNRYWQMLFGTGLVATSEDFGSQGRTPSHPALLDWLARDFIDHEWDVQHLLKQIALSATYRQSSDIASGELTTLDPENTLLYRYPAPRLSAEMIRDNALHVSGLLVDEIGGPPVKPYDIALSFKPSKIGAGSDLYRRSLYTYWKQTGPAPVMTTLNASKRDVCRVRLEKTDSPLQGLVLLNAPQFVEAARTMGARLVEIHGTDNDAIIDETYRRLTSRRPNEEERPILRQLLLEQEAHFSEHIESAKSLLATGASAPLKTENPAHLAAVTALISTVMNFDECITKR